MEALKLKTSKDYSRKNAPVTWAVVTKEGIVMDCDFITIKEAIDFRDNAYFGYYKDCEVVCIKRRDK